VQIRKGQGGGRDGQYATADNRGLCDGACSLRSRPRRNRTALLTAIDDRERLIALIYEGVIDGEVWQELLALLGDRLNAAGTGLGLQDIETHEIRAVAEAGIDRGLHVTYCGLAPENRIAQAIGGAGRPMADWMVMPKSELVASPLHSEWFARQGFHGVMAAPILARDSLSGVVIAFCSKNRSDFAEEDLDLLAGFAPHLGRVVGCASSERGLSPS
jgi:GAF domain-containing protein